MWEVNVLLIMSGLFWHQTSTSCSKCPPLRPLVLGSVFFQSTRLCGIVITNDRAAFDGELQKLYSDPYFFFCFQGLLEIRSVSVGVVAIKSVSTGLYLAMSKKGTLFGSVSTQQGHSLFRGHDGRVWKGWGAVEVWDEHLPKMSKILLKWGEITGIFCPEKGQMLSIIAVHLGYGWWYLQLQLSYVTVKIDTGEKGIQRSTDKEPAGLL